MAIPSASLLAKLEEERKKEKLNEAETKPQATEKKSILADLARVGIDTLEQIPNIGIDLLTLGGQPPHYVVGESKAPTEESQKGRRQDNQKAKKTVRNFMVDSLVEPFRASGFTETADRIKESIVDKEGKIKETETITGTAASIVPYIMGGTKIYSKLSERGGKILRGATAGAITDQLLADTQEGEGNLFNVLAEVLPENGAKTVAEYISSDEEDSQAVERIKLLGEGTAIGGLVDILGGTIKAGQIAYKNFKKKFPDLTDEERGEALYLYLKDAKETTDLKAPEDKIVFTETPEGTAQVQLQANSKINRFINRFLTTRGFFTPKAYNAFEDSQYAQRQVIAKAEHTANRLQEALNNISKTKEGPEIFKSVNDALTADLKFTRGLGPKDKISDIANEFNLPKDIAEEVLNARELIDDMSRQLVGSSAVKDSLKETIVENSGQYMRRSYRLFEDSGYSPDEKVRLDAEDYLTNLNLKRDPNLSETFARQQAKDQVDEILSSGSASEFSDYFSAVRKVNKNILKKKEDVPDPIRALMGEVTEPSENVVLTVSKMVNLLETNKFYQNLDKLGESGGYIFKEGQPRDNKIFSVKITGTNSVLDGKYTTPEILSEIQNNTSRFFKGDKLGWYKNFLTLKGTSQKLKTVFSHVTHIRNFTGGAQFGAANGVNPFGGQARQTFKALRNSVLQGGNKELDALYEKYLRLGIINTNVRVNEFRDLLNVGYESGVNNLGDNISKKLQSYGISKNKQQLVDNIYVATDDFYKINYYNQELATLRQHMPEAPLEVLEERAADIVRNTMPNYDRVPKGIKALKELPVGSFFSFPAEIIRTSKNIVKQAATEMRSGIKGIRGRGAKRLAGFTATTSGWSGLAATTAHLAGFGQEEQEAIAILSETPWSKDSPRNVIRVEDKIYTNDTQFVDSYSVIKEPFRAAARAYADGDINEEDFDKKILDATGAFAFNMFRPYIDEAILTDALTDVMFAAISSDGRTSKGKEIFTPGLTTSEKTGNMLTHLGQTLVPGSALSIKSLMGAAFEQPNKNTGKVKNVNAELAANLTGFKFQELDVENVLRFGVSDFKRASQDIINVGVNYKRSGQDLVDRYRQRQEAKLKLSQELYRKVTAAEVLVGRGETYRYLMSNGLSRKETAFFMAGNFKPDRPNKSLLLLMNDKTTFKSDETLGETYKQMMMLYADFMKTDLIAPIELKEEEEEPTQRTKKVEGGLVGELVPNAPKNPSARINKYTGVSYAEEAGAAFMDELNPVRSLKMAEGGKVRNRKYSGGVIAKALGIKGADLEWAKSQRQRYPEKEAYDGKGDAAAHLALGFITQRSKNPKAALAAANIREYVTMDTVGRPMDIHNNKLGAEIKAKNFKEAEKEIDRLIKESSAKFMTPSESKKRRKYGAGSKVLKEGLKYFAEKKQSGLFSKAEKEAGNLDQKEGTGDVMLKRLRDRGVTDEELEFTGAKETFESRPSVTKTELLNHFKDRGFDVETFVGKEKGHQITDFNPGDPWRTVDNQDYDEWFNANYRDEYDQLDLQDDALDLDEIDDMKDDLYLGKITEYIDDVNSRADTAPLGKNEFGAKFQEEELEANEGYGEILVALPKQFKKANTKNFRGDHWDQDNVIVHVRVADAYGDKNGNKMMMIDEIQSDFHQGKKTEPPPVARSEDEILKELKEFQVGHKDTKAKIKKLEDEHPDVIAAYEKAGFEADGLTPRQQNLLADNGRLKDGRTLYDEEGTLEFFIDSLVEESRLARNSIREGDLPFRKEKKWALLGLKKAMINAVDKGYDKVSLSNYEIQKPKTNNPRLEPFYNKTLVRLLDSNFAKKYGSKIEYEKVNYGGRQYEVPTMKITDEMREAIDKGLTMFAEGGLVASEVLTNKLRGNNGV